MQAYMYTELVTLTKVVGNAHELIQDLYGIYRPI